MTETFTLDELFLKYLYGDSTELEKKQVDKAIENPIHFNRLLEFGEAMGHLQETKVAPSENCINNILAYSKGNKITH